MAQFFLAAVSFRRSRQENLSWAREPTLFSSVEEVGERLRSTGYIADSVGTSTVFLAARLHKPLLLEGPAGSGKTQLAYAVAEAAGTTIERLQCYEGINEEKAIGKFDEALQKLCVELRAKSASIDCESLQTELHSQQFFSAEPVLRALQHEKPCVLLIDEVDKVDHAFEAQAFKRSCACFGLGRYLYHFEGVWIDLDDRKRPRQVPRLPAWATPDGWHKGLRPNAPTAVASSVSKADEKTATEVNAVVQQIEAMAKPLGRGLYRGLLRSVRVWSPNQIADPTVQRKVLEQMQSAERGLERLRVAIEKTGSGPLNDILRSLKLRSLDAIDSLEALKQVVLAIEAVVSSQR
jgi:SpoVK/Ycf46/Vps4 family AAA+-type ATPase